MSPSAQAQITDAVSRETSVFNFGQATIASDAVSREVSVFNVGQSTVGNDAVSREVSVFNVGPSTVSSDAVSREVSVFNTGPSTVSNEAVSREVSVFNVGPTTLASDAISREVSVLNNGPGPAVTNICDPPPSGLVGWWPGQSNAVDVVEGNNGILEGGASFAAGEVGEAFSFDGANQYVQIADSAALEPASLTLECWFNASNSTGALLCKPLGGGSADSFAFWFQGGSLNGKLCSNSSGGPAVSYGFTPTPGVWYHAAYTFDSTSQIQTIYIDGVPVATGAANLAIGYDSHPVLIGADNDGGSPVLLLNGEIDEASIYNRALSAAEIQAIYSAGSFGKCAEVLALVPEIVKQPSSEMVLPAGNVAFTVGATGAAPLAYQWKFDGINLTDNGRVVGSSSNVLTIADVSGTDAGEYSVVVTNVYGSATSQPAALTTGYLFGLYNTGVDTNGNPLAGGAIDPHYALVSSADPSLPGPDAYAYTSVPGSYFMGSGTNSDWISTTAQGGDGSTGNFDFQTTFYVGAPGVAYASISGVFAADNSATILLNGQPVSGTYAPGFNEWYPFAITNGFISGTNKLDFIVNNSGGQMALQVAMSGTASPPPNCDPPPSGLVGWWPGQSNAVSVVGGNNGMLEGGASFGTGEVGEAFSFSGADQYVQIADSPTLEPASVTLECWFNASATSGNLISKPVGGGYYDSYQIWMQGGYLNGGAGNTNGYGEVSYALTPVPGVWYHAAYTFDTTSQIQALYLDGVLVASNSANLSISYDSHPVLIGTEFDDGAPVLPFTGEIDEVSIYNRALSATEIQAIYNAGSAGKCTELLPPVIVQQPASQTNFVGGEVNFVVVAGGSAPLAYQWAWNGTTISDATNASLVLTNIQFSNSGSYSVLVSNAFGTTDSAAANLTVVAPNLVQNGNFATGDFTDWTLSGNISYDSIETVADGNAPGAPPSSTYFAELGPNYPPIVMTQTIPTTIGDNYTFSFYISRSDYDGVGSGSPAGGSGAEFTASLGGVQLFDTLDTLIASWTLESYIVVATASNEVVQFTSVSPPGYYYVGDICVVDDGPASAPNSSPWILVQPNNLTVGSGSNAVFQVSATGAAPLSYQWVWNGTNLPAATNASLLLNNVQFTSDGSYSVTISNAFGTTNSQAATLAVYGTPALTWTNPPAIGYGTALGTNQLNATASVPGIFRYASPLGTVLNAGTDTLSVVFTPVDANDYSSAAASVTLVVTPAPLSVKANNATRAYGQANPIFTGILSGLVNGDPITATYACSAVSFSPPGAYPIVPTLVDPNNRLGNYTVMSTNGTLTVTAGPPPVFAGISPDTGLTNGGTVVTISGSGFELGASVFFGGQPASNIVVSSGSQISAVTPASSLGTTNVVVRNPDGTSAALTDGFTFTGTPPSFLSQPASLLLVPGSNAVFQVSAAYAAGYQWQFNGGNLSDNGRITGSHGPTLTIPAVQSADVGVYQVIITNAWGTAVSAPASLAIIVSPSIGIPPQSQSVGIGGTATFSVGVNGTAPFTYQWFLGGTPVTGATNSVLSITDVQAANQGQQYSVKVGNAAGLATSAAATLTVLNYCASAQPGQSVYPMGSSVPLSVQTFNCSSQAPVPNASVTVWISTAGTTRSLPATTSGSGSTFVNFTPLPTEAGTYQVAAALPGQGIPAVQGAFSLVGMSLSRNSVTSVLTPGVPVTNAISLNNLTGVALTGIKASVVGSAPDVQVTLNASASLAGNASGTLTITLLAPGPSAAQDQFAVQLTTAQGNTNTVEVTANVVPPAAQLVATPASLNGTMVGGGQTLISFYVSNTGGATSGPVQVALPSAAWLTTVTPLPLPPIAPGQSNQVTLALTPAASLALGAYPGTLELTSSNAEVTVPFQFDCVSDLKGSLLVTVQDELSIYGAGAPNVSNATVTVTDFLTGHQVATAVTDASGELWFPNLTSAYYTVAVTAPDHGSFNTTLLLAANETNDLTAFLDLDLVDYTWIVTPTVVPDHYTFTLQTTFATEVPWPVVTVNPGAIDLCSITGTTQLDLTITNSGLIAAQGLELYFGTNPNWLIQPLATNLGDLLPESSLVVPVIITQLGSNTTVASSIPAQLTYQVAALNATNLTTVPIYVFDANPLDCEPQNPTPAPVAVLSGGGGGGVSITPPNYTVQTPQAALVEVKLQIDQTAVIAANAFSASLQLVNNAGASVSNLAVNITVYDASNHVANTLFGIPAPMLNGLNAVDGTGVLANGATGSASWIIVPTTNAAPSVSTPFSVGGSFSYVLNGEPVTISLYAVPISVLPTPILNVDYFLQHDVYSQDPFTNVVEASIPFALGLLVHNTGYGNANDFTITSAQPQIIQNSNDLLIAFQLIASQEGTNQSISPSFTLDFGNLGPQSVADGLWYMTSTLEGDFISFSATYQHVNDFGNTNTSVINSVHIHEMNHVVELTGPTNDDLPDYLVNDTTNVDALPDVVYSSNGTTNVVTSFTNGVASGFPSAVSTNITVTVPATPGWGYFEIIDPGNGVYPVASVTRSDGGKLLVGPNVWQTPARLHMVPPKPNNLIHIFDYNSTGTYTVTYGLPILAPTVTTLDALNVTPTTATLNAIVNPNGASTEVYFQWGATTNYGHLTSTTTLTQSLNDTQAVTIAAGDLPYGSTTHFRAVGVNSAGTTYGADVTLVTPSLPPPMIVQVTNRSIVDGQSLVISNHVQVATPPAIFSLDSSAPAGATITTNGVFKWTPACLQGSSTNIITVWVTDSSTPPLSNAMSFAVSVGECVQLELGSTAMQVGTTGGVQVTLLSTVGLTNLSWALSNPAGRFTNWVFASSNAAIAGVTSTQIFFNLGTSPGQTLQSPALLGTIYMKALAGPSAFLPVVATNILGTKSDGSVDGNITSEAGRIAVIGSQPLLEPVLGSNSLRTLILYDNPGTNYELLVNASLISTNWEIYAGGTITNLIQYFPVNPAAQQLFFQAH